MSLNAPTKKLPSGADIPVIGLGVYKRSPALSSLVIAISPPPRFSGTRRTSVVPWGDSREDIFATSELCTSTWGYDEAMAASKTSNEELGLGYIDLYLLHTPGPTAKRDETWRALEDLQQQGIVENVGVSNFGEAHLEKFLKTSRVKPVADASVATVVNYCRPRHPSLLAPG